jgi:hypothetical protein
MRRRGSAALAVLVSLAALWPAAPVRADLLSKQYLFKADVVLEVGAATADGLRLDAVRFTLPATQAERFVRASGLIRADVAVTNTTADSRKVGLAIALFDAEGHLVGVASGGNKLGAVKAGEQKNFTLVFDGVNAEAPRATTFRISLESK